jgi:hypothetical protein
MQPSILAQPQERGVSTQVQPYRRGWFDNLLLALDHLGFWGWVILLGITLAQFLYVNAMFWMNGMLPAGTFEFGRAFFVLLIPYVIGVWM